MTLKLACSVLLSIMIAITALSTGSLPWFAPSAAVAQTSDSEKEAFEASKELGTRQAWEAYLKAFPNGFRADLARAYLAKLSEGTPAPRETPSAPARVAAESVTLTADVIQVGKWPERAAYDGRSLWVSESGNRSIAEIDLGARRVLRRLKVGRLPVDIVATENGTVYTLAETDNALHVVTRQSTSTAGVFAEVPRCADILAYAATNLWIVSNLDCSAPAVLSRVSHNNGRTAKVADLAAGPSDMKAAHGHVYVAHMGTGGRAAFVAVFDERSGSGRAAPDLAIHYPRLAVNDAAVFIGGAPLDSTIGIVTKLAAGAANYEGELRLPEPIVALAATDQYVAAVGRSGTIFVLSAGDLAVLRTITTGQKIEAHDVVAIGNSLVVVSSAGNEVARDNRVYVIDGWRPGSPAVAAPVRSAPVVGTAPPPLRCGENYKLVRGECILQQNCGANATRSPEGDCYCNRNFEMVNGRCLVVQRKPPQQVRDNCPGDSVLRNGRCVKENEDTPRPPIACKGGQLYSLSQQRCVCQDGLKWNGQRCYLP